MKTILIGSHKVAGKYIEPVAVLTNYGANLPAHESACLAGKLQREYRILQKLKNLKTVVKAHDFFFVNMADATVGFLIEDYAPAGDLQNFLGRTPLSYEQRLHLCSTLIEAVLELHAHQVIHSDLKEQNVVISNLNKEIYCQLIDFELSCVVEPYKKKDGSSGTIERFPPDYAHKHYHLREMMGQYQSDPNLVALQEIMSAHGELIEDYLNFGYDVWTTGIIICRIMFGTSPVLPLLFDEADEDVEITKDEILQRLAFLQDDAVENIFSGDDELSRIIKRMLSCDCADRPTMSEVSEAWARLPNNKDASFCSDSEEEDDQEDDAKDDESDSSGDDSHFARFQSSMSHYNDCVFKLQPAGAYSTSSDSSQIRFVISLIRC